MMGKKGLMTRSALYNHEHRMQVEMATNDMKGRKPSSYIDTSMSRGSRYKYSLSNVHLTELIMLALIQVQDQE